jgi:hypothetical protein
MIKICASNYTILQVGNHAGALRKCLSISEIEATAGIARGLERFKVQFTDQTQEKVACA